MSLYARIFEFIPDAVLVVGADGRIREANPQAATMFGFKASELQSRLVDELIPRRFGHGHAAHRQAYLSRATHAAHGRQAGIARGTRRRPRVSRGRAPQSDGRRQWSGRALRHPRRDRTTQGRPTPARFTARKEILLREIHHRVKNNLAVISSLLYMQSTRITDLETTTVLEESQRRVRSMALVHETLYRSGNLSSVEFADYAASLCEEVRHSQRIPGQSIEFDLSLSSPSRCRWIWPCRVA